MSDTSRHCPMCGSKDIKPDGSGHSPFCHSLWLRSRAAEVLAPYEQLEVAVEALTAAKNYILKVGSDSDMAPVIQQIDNALSEANPTPSDPVAQQEKDALNRAVRRAIFAIPAGHLSSRDIIVHEVCAAIEREMKR